jgi:hypothetical protein
MEHRWGRRVATDVDVRIFADPASAGWGRLRNISVSGGFVETALRIPVLCTLCLTAPATDSRDEYLVRAIVVRNTADGVGVEWCEGDSSAIPALMHEAAATWHSPVRVSDELRF